MPFAIEVHAVEKRFGPIHALRGVSFRAMPSTIHAICGENGAGKSTLLNILTGVLRPDSGRLLVGGEELPIRDPRDAQNRGIALVSQELSIAPHLTVFDNIWLGCRDVPFFHQRRDLRERAAHALSRVGLDHVELSRPAGALSLGERQLVEIARALVRDADILLLDEPTATLTDTEIEHVFLTLRALRSEGKAIVFITHRLGEVIDLCDHVTVLRNGADVWSSPVGEVNRDRLIEQMLGRPLQEMYPETRHDGTAVGLVVDGLCVAGAVDDVSFIIPRGTVTCLAGQIGSGAFETLRAVAGLSFKAQGNIEVLGQSLRPGSVSRAQRAKVRFVSEDRASEGLFLRLPVSENLAATQLGAVTTIGHVVPGRLRRLTEGLANVVGLDRKRLSSRCEELSGGNQQKVSIGRAISAADPGVIVMNEPTRGVDVGARAEIYATLRRLCDGGHTILIASTDIEEVVGLADQVITLYRGRKVGEYHRGEISRSRILVDITHPTAQERPAA